MKSESLKEEIAIELEDITMDGHLVLPENARGLVLFSHGSGSSRFSPRNNFVAKQLQEHNIGTLLFDLLSKHEDAIYENRFDIDLLTERLLAATQWVRHQSKLKNLPIGYFGASTGAASALRASIAPDNHISAIVSRGGRPDLAIPLVGKVKAPTLLIVGGKDTQVITLNKQAYKQLQGPKELKIVEGASHLFEEERKLTEVVKLASDWFTTHLKKTQVRNASEH